jgi:hypothetical protein
MDASVDLTPELLDSKLAAVFHRDTNPSERQATIDWFVRLCNTGEIRDVDPGFSPAFYTLFFRLIGYCLHETLDMTAEAPLPDELPMPTDSTCELA